MSIDAGNPSPTDCIGSYRKLQEIGAGGTGSVFRAIDERSGKEYAIKVLDAGAFAEPIELARFKREIEVLEVLSSTSRIVDVCDSGVTPYGTPYFVMTLVEGRSLTEVVTAEGPLSWQRAIEYVLPITMSMADVHHWGIIHRDIKPSNILIDSSDCPILVDFGLARVTDDATLSPRGQVIGTPQYMAPELTKGIGIRNATKASDVYTLGATIYFLLSGTPPFQGSDPLAIVHKVRTSSPVPISERTPGLPRDVVDVIERAMARDPGDRYPDAGALAHALEKIQASTEQPKPTSVSLLSLQGGLARKIGSRLSHNPLSKVVLGAAVLLLACLGFMKFSFFEQSSPKIVLVEPTPNKVTRELGVSVEGYVDGGEIVEFLVGERRVESEDGRFATHVMLKKEGANRIDIVGRDDAGNEIQKDLVVVRDTTPPALVCAALLPNGETATRYEQVEIEGQVKGGSEVVVAGRSVSVREGYFASTVELEREGVNRITVLAFDRAGNTTRRELEVVRDTVSPEVRYRVPPKVTGETASIRVSANEKIFHLQIDGRSGSIQGNSGMATVSVPPGGRNFTVAVTDAAGNKTVRDIWIHRPPQLKDRTGKQRIADRSERGVDAAEIGWHGEKMPGKMRRGAKVGEYIWEPDGSVMVYVRAGVFQMGSKSGKQNERPVHPVSLGAFYVDKKEVTVSRFKQFVDATGYVTDAERLGWSLGIDFQRGGKWVRLAAATWRSPGIPTESEKPVVHVSWNDAQAYCDWAEKRLPTEAEWEYAARGADGRSYPWGEKLEAGRANFADRSLPGELGAKDVSDGFAYLAPSGAFPRGASWCGALDMSGNVLEWCRDSYSPDFYNDSPRKDPVNYQVRGAKVVRGGSWCQPSSWLLVTSRSGYRGHHVAQGFRCVVSAFPPPEAELLGFKRDGGEEGFVESYTIGVVNFRDYPDRLFVSSPSLPPIGGNKKASRTIVTIYDDRGRGIYGYASFTQAADLKSMQFAVKRKEPTDAIRLVLQDRAKGVKYRSNWVPVPRMNEREKQNNRAVLPSPKLVLIGANLEETYNSHVFAIANHSKFSPTRVRLHEDDGTQLKVWGKGTDWGFMKYLASIKGGLPTAVYVVLEDKELGARRSNTLRIPQETLRDRVKKMRDEARRLRMKADRDHPRFSSGVETMSVAEAMWKSENLKGALYFYRVARNHFKAAAPRK